MAAVSPLLNCILTFFIPSALRRCFSELNEGTKCCETRATVHLKGLRLGQADQRHRSVAQTHPSSLEAGADGSYSKQQFENEVVDFEASLFPGSSTADGDFRLQDLLNKTSAKKIVIY